MSSRMRPANRLAGSTSPYLLQHARNPVDWYPWGEEALRRAREEDRPIFLSIGYAACHWCHVMERESFESEETAALLNRDFVPIKVDREERPDLDEIYMTATQLMTQRGGWPMSVFLTPDLKPFYAGTYFPPEDRWGMPGFRTVLREMARLWREQRAQMEERGERVTEAIAQITGGGRGAGSLDESLVRDAVPGLGSGFDARNGGFGPAPKFPPSMRLELFLRRYRQEPEATLLRWTTLTLDRMARGGMYDQVGGGFHRYSTDEQWLVPHFEKMLYDNALLARVYTLAFEATGNWYYGRVAREIFDYVIREMTHPEGGFYSTTDADSEGEEGKFFVWSPDEVLEALGPEDGALFNRIYDIAPGGNFEGHSIPNLLPRDLEEWAKELGTSAEALDGRLAPLRRRLWEKREQRVHPLLDDKILSGWNGLMIRAFAEGFRVLGEPRYRETAERAAAFVLTRMREGERLLRAFRDGRAHLNAYHEDYAYLAVALLDLHAAAGSDRWREDGLALVEQMDARFWDEEEGGYFFTSHDHEQLIARAKSPQDGATPSGNSMAALALIRAAKLTGEDRYRLRASQVLAGAVPQMREMPAGFPNMLVAAGEYLEEWKMGIQVPGSDAVRVEAFLSHSSVRPGERFWIGVRLRITEGYHLNSHHPGQPYLIPTTLAVDPEEGLTPVRESYPVGAEYAAPFQSEPLSVYTGTVLLGAEIQVAPDASPGRRALSAVLRLQACDERQCYPPMHAPMQLPITLTAEPGQEQFPEIFAEIYSQAAKEINTS